MCRQQRGRNCFCKKLFTTADNKEIGSAKFYQEGDGNIKMDLEIDFPARADSMLPFTFMNMEIAAIWGENTHGHWNPTKEAHGKWAQRLTTQGI